MTTLAPVRRTPPLARVAVVVTAAALAAVGVLGAHPIDSLATLTDADRTQAATVSSGSVSLDLSSAAGTGTWTGSVALVPGQAAYSGITVTNDGASGLRYSVTSESLSTLAATLLLDVVVVPPTTSCEEASFVTGTTVAGPSAFGATQATALFGSAEPGDQPGDRALAAGASDHLCARVTFPFGSGLGAAARGSSASTVFTFVAENS